MTIKIGICGSNGKMGRMIINKINQLQSCIISATFTRASHIHALNDFCQNSDVIIDFSSPDILEKLLDCALIHKTKLIIGTTGLTKHHLGYLNKAAENLSILYSANMSLGANLITIVAEKIAKILDRHYDIEIQDKHHRLKKDAPSGTAIMIGKAVAKARNLEFDKCAILNRHDRGPRLANEIGITSVRGGNIYGEHDVFFLGDNETITIKHQALNKESFVDGAIQATHWIFDKPYGLYSMMDVFLIK